jgi:hypothetical protein
MNVFETAKQELEGLIDLLKPLQRGPLNRGESIYIRGELMGLMLSLEVLKKAYLQEVKSPKTAAVTEWAKDHPELQVQDLPCREVAPEDLKGLPTIND